MSTELNIERAALLLVDLQRDLLHADGAAAHAGLGALERGDGARLIGTWQHLADTMRDADRPVVWVETAFRRDYHDAAVATPWLEQRRPTGGDFLVEGSWGAELLDGLERDPDDYVVVKKGHGAFQDTPLDRLLTNLGVDQCIIAGGGVADSVTETVRTAGILGYRTFVVRDAVYPPNAPELSDSALRILPRGQMTSVADVVRGALDDEPHPGESTTSPDYALLIIDMQNDFVSPDRPAVRYRGSAPFAADKSARMLSNAQRVADATRSRGWPVVHVHVVRRADNLDDVHGKGEGGVGDNLPPGVTHVARGTWGAEIVSELQPQENDFLVEKKGASGFGLTYLHRLLRNLGVHRCLLAGGSTTGCVRATMFDGIALGYDMTIVGDATYPPESPQLEFLGRWCPVRSADDVVAEISPTPV
jgi:nicotinamidase-related amidase